ncbi:hypothetical protein [Alloactinosynnema sp. L-07]|uniref:hypothetical protein n=1 Tax=Alloactinosynnema sp. L-07 TaxID=1653480 RepID=UPI00065EFD89|nr:hypothetical protein [Alloactinosynnema sp. L-07]CRK59102.1 hypothetical protein [Alloactinosynnema sp. L-07]
MTSVLVIMAAAVLIAVAAVIDDVRQRRQLRRERLHRIQILIAEARRGSRG